MDSILTHIKKLIGIDETYEQFDVDIIDGINVALSNLAQNGLGDNLKPFTISSKDETWTDYFNYIKSTNKFDPTPFESLVKQYIKLKTETLFDPQSSSILKDTKNQQMDELIWRIYANVIDIANNEVVNDG